METYRQTLVNLSLKRSKTIFYYFLTLGILYVIYGIFYSYNKNDVWSGTLWLLTGLGFISYSVIQKNTLEKYFIELNDNVIKAKLALFKSINIKWDEIIELDIKPITIHFILKSDSKEELSLGNLNYNGVLKIKSKIKEFADGKGIKIK